MAAGFAHLSMSCGLCDGYVLSSVALMGQCLRVHFTDKTAKVLAGALQWLLSAHSSVVAPLALRELTRVLRYSADTYAGIFARRESDRSNVRKSGLDATGPGAEGAGGGDKPTLVAVPALFSTHPILPETTDRYAPCVGDQLGAHTVLIDFMDYIFETLLVRRDLDGILFSCLEVVLMDSAIYPSLNLLGSISTSNASKASASYFTVGIAIPMYRLLGFGLKLLHYYGSSADVPINDAVVGSTSAFKCMSSCYSNTMLSLLQYCQHNDISVTGEARGSPALARKVGDVAALLQEPSLQAGFRHTLDSVCMSRRRILRERIYSFAFKCCNAPNNSLNGSPRQNIHRLHKLYQGTFRRCIDTEIKVLLDFLDLLQFDADTCWGRDYETENACPPTPASGSGPGSAPTPAPGSAPGSDQNGLRSRRPGPYEVVRWVDRSLYSPATHHGHGQGKQASSVGAAKASFAEGGAQASDEVRTVLFNPRSIFAHQRVAASGSLLQISPPEDDAEAHLSEASVAMQRFCGIAAGSKPGAGGRKKDRENMLALHSNTGVLHLAKMCLAIQLDRMYAWQGIIYEEILKHKLKRDKCPRVLSDHLFATIKYNICRRGEILSYFHDSCCTKSGIHTAVLAAWAFHPSLALRLDQAFQYRALTHEHGSKAISNRHRIRMNAIVNILVSDMKQEVPTAAPPVLTRSNSTVRRKNKENSLRKMTSKISNQLYELCLPRISDLIAHNPVALRADYSSAGYLLGIVGDVTFRTAHKFAAKSVPRKGRAAGARAMSQLRMWAIYGDKNIHTIFNRLGHHHEYGNADAAAAAAGGGTSHLEGEMDYQRSSLLRERQQRVMKNVMTHRSARCPMYLLSHWAVAPPDYAIGLLQRPILTHLGRSIDRTGTHGGESGDERQLELWQEKLNAQYFVVQYVIRSLSALDPETLLFYLPQLVQLLRRDKLGAIRTFLDEQAKTSDLLCHQLVWLLETESVSEVEVEAAAAERLKHKHQSKSKSTSAKKSSSDPADAASEGAGGEPDKGLALVERSELYIVKDLRFGYCNQLSGHDSLPSLAQRLQRLVVSSLSPRALAYMTLECEYFNAITNISAKLALERNKDLHNHMIRDEMCKMGMRGGLYLPTDPHRLLIGVDAQSGTPMQSAAKCPFLLVFRTTHWAGPDSMDHHAEEGGGPPASAGDGDMSSGCAGAETLSILSNKVLPTSLQPIRIRHSSLSHLGGPDQDTDTERQRNLSPRTTHMHMNAGANGNGHNSSVSLSEDGLSAAASVDDESEPNEEGSDDPSKEFANIRKSRGGKSNQYRTLMVNNYNKSGAAAASNAQSDASSGIEMQGQHKLDKKQNPKVYSVSAIRKDFYKSVSQLSHGRALRKGTEKWYEHWDAHANDGPAAAAAAAAASRDKDGKSPGPPPVVANTACIFKVYDDCRQDALTIQFIRVLYDAYALEHRMPLYLYPYRVVPNRTGKAKAMGGIIQVSRRRLYSLCTVCYIV
jgi:hypothetical protein